MPDSENVQRRLERLEDWRAHVEVRLERFSSDLQKNTEMTASVKRDTEQVVTLLKASKINLGIIKWLLGAVAAIAATWAAVDNLFKH